MIATGLVFLLGALVATLLTLLFVPFLWRNAQRLARRDFAATMPATMNEIRAEVDRVRAEAAMTVRRHEMLTQKARERLALERAKVGRLTASNADSLFLSEQRQGEANALRAQLDALQQRADALDETRIELEQENAALREALAQAEADLRALPPAGAEAGATLGAPGEPSVSQEPEQARITAATAALLALARDYRRERKPEPNVPSGEPVGRSAGDPAVAELMAMAKEPAPTDPAERKLRNANVRERIAELASRFLPSDSTAAASAKASEPSPPAEPEPVAPTPRKASSGPRPKRRRGSQRNRSQPPR